MRTLSGPKPIFLLCFLFAVLACAPEATTGRGANRDELLRVLRSRMAKSMPEAQALSVLSDLTEDNAVILLGDRHHYRVIKVGKADLILMLVHDGRVIAYTVARSEKWLKDGSRLAEGCLSMVPGTDEWVSIQKLEEVLEPVKDPSKEM